MSRFWRNSGLAALLLPALALADPAADAAQRLLAAYPDFLSAYQDNAVRWQDGTVMLFDDGRVKSFQERLDDADLEDQLSLTYPVGAASFVPPAPDDDPGRIRFEPLFKKMYGASRKAVEANLTTIIWLPRSSGQRIKISKINGIDKKLQAVSDELDRLPAALKQYVDTPAGTYNWRPIAGTERLSAHSFGIAIDINAKQGDYWRWQGANTAPTYRNRIPREIVEIFEKHGFIWGGKWYHYDTLHFEYRPELLAQ